MTCSSRRSSCKLVHRPLRLTLRCWNRHLLFSQAKQPGIIGKTPAHIDTRPTKSLVALSRIPKQGGIPPPDSEPQGRQANHRTRSPDAVRTTTNSDSLPTSHQPSRNHWWNARGLLHHQYNTEPTFDTHSATATTTTGDGSL